MGNESLKNSLQQAHRPKSQLAEFLDKNEANIRAYMPEHSKDAIRRQLSNVNFAVQSSEALQKCSLFSVYSSVIKACQMGLEIGIQGQCFLVPYGTTATCVPGWQGLVDIVSRSGRATVWTGAVFDGDTFDYELGDRPFLKHKPMGESDPAKMTHAYAIGWVKNAEFPVIECWPAARIERHRNKYNKQGTKHYSYRDWEMYARKIPLLQVLKYMPKSIELERAMRADPDARGQTFDGDFRRVPHPDDQFPPPDGAMPDPMPQDDDDQNPPGAAASQEAPNAASGGAQQAPQREPHPSDNDEPPPGVGRVYNEPRRDSTTRPSPRPNRRNPDLG